MQTEPNNERLEQMEVESIKRWWVNADRTIPKLHIDFLLSRLEKAEAATWKRAIEIAGRAPLDTIDPNVVDGPTRRYKSAGETRSSIVTALEAAAAPGKEGKGEG